VSASDLHRTITAIHRRESAKLVAGLMRIVRDVGVAEELAQDAFLAALEQWPKEGLPQNAGAWLMGAAKNRAINVLRRGPVLERKLGELANELATVAEERMGANHIDERLDDEIGDDVLRLVFIACHPILAMEARVALTLRLVGGLTTEEIAHAFLVSEPTIAQRIVRAKRALAEARVPFELPRGDALGERLSSVLAVVYLVFNEGYSASAGDDLMRPQLVAEALRLAHLLVALAPLEPEVHALAALLEIQSSRAGARTNHAGDPVLLLDQDRTKWDRDAIGRGLAALERTKALGGEHGHYALQAAIAACHARAAKAEDTDWTYIAELYGELAAQTGAPVVELNRAVVVSMARGPAAGLAILEPLMSEPSLRDYHLLPSARADMLEKLGRAEEARTEYERAASLTKNAREATMLRERAASCGRRGD
jgi:RNA polymerase sigma factor (sigma-70 family)